MFFILALIDLFAGEWAVQINKEYHFNKSVPHFFVKMIMVVLSQVCTLNEKIGIHDNAVALLYLCLVVILVSMYLVKVSIVFYFIFSSFLPNTLSLARKQ